MGDEFSVSEQGVDKLHIVTWNINAVKNKLDNIHVKSVLGKADIIFLNEIKTPLSFHMPGYVTYTSEGQNPHRGGCALLLRNCMNDLLCHIDCSKSDMIHFQLKPYPRVIFVSCYIPPKDSPYFSMDSVAELNSLISEGMQDYNFAILGDMNCRFASRRDGFLDNVKDVYPNLYYSPAPVSIKVPNENAKLLTGILRPLVLANGLSGYGFDFPHKLTFRQKNKWISELDHCFVSPAILPAVVDLRIEDSLMMPSNHAPVFVAFDTEKLINTESILQDLAQRARELGDHSTLSEQPQKGLAQRQMRWSDVDHNVFAESLSETNPPQIEADLDRTFTRLEESIRDSLSQSQITSQPKMQGSPA